jgi:hypothetical protein
MKNHLLLLPVMVLILTGCAKNTYDRHIEEPNDWESLYQEPSNPFQGVPDSMAMISISVSAVKYNESQKPYLISENATIVMWPSKNRILEIIDVDNMIKGVALDKNTNTKVSTQNIAQTNSIWLQDYPPGKYLIAVVLNDQIEKGKRAYSTKEIELVKYGKINLHKIFSPHIQDGKYEQWSTK